MKRLVAMLSRHRDIIAKRGLLALFAVIAVACVSEPLEFPDWTIPVPEGTRIIEYAAVPIEERTERIELVEDLVIKQRDGDPNYSFYQPSDIAVDDEGRIYVLDAGNVRVQVFDSAGRYIDTLGRKGQGPEELLVPIGIAVTGERVVVYDVQGRRFTVWGTDGQHVGEFRLAGGSPFEAMTGVSAGAIVTRFLTSDERGRRDIVASISTQGGELARYSDVAFAVAPIMGNCVRMTVIFPSPSFAASRAGVVYATDSREYQVHAFDLSGAGRWALRVAAARLATDATVREHAVELLRGAVPGLDPTGAEWPDSLPALSALNVDGHGRLYVFPYHWQSQGWGPYGPMEPGTDSVPVDVYSPAGERLFTGMMQRWTWKAAHGDFLYGFRPDESGEHEIVRYRVVEAF